MDRTKLPPGRNPGPPGIPAEMVFTPEISEEAKALHRIADALERQAEATLMLARATAGEFDEAEDVPEPAKPGQGMGMGG